MNTSKTYKVIIIGGGLAGLSAALHLSKNNVDVLLIEKYKYPHHKVCGEYVSNEVVPYLRELGIDPFKHGALPISKFELSSKNGETVKSQLPLGGFGMSRYALDNLMYETVKDKIDVLFTIVDRIHFSSETFSLTTKEKDIYKAQFVIGAFGKRSGLDTFLNRDFIKQKSPWLGVKAHYDYEFPGDTVALHNFDGGYCGLSKVESGAINACYLATYESFKQYGSIEVFQSEVLSKNPNLKHFFDNARLKFKKPLSISQISFLSKAPVENHIFMIGDSAGLIHPLCGNGMAMAIHSAKIVSELLLQHFEKRDTPRAWVEKQYSLSWKETFSNRLRTGKTIQNLLLRPTTAHYGLKVAQIFPSIIPKIIKKTHGDLLV